MTKSDFAPQWRKSYAAPVAKTIGLDAKTEILIGSTPDQFSRKKDVDFDDTEAQDWDEDVKITPTFSVEW